MCINAVKSEDYLALDAEWKPVINAINEHYSIHVLQISTIREVFLFSIKIGTINFPNEIESLLRNYKITFVTKNHALEDRKRLS